MAGGNAYDRRQAQRHPTARETFRREPAPERPMLQVPEPPWSPGEETVAYCDAPAPEPTAREWFSLKAFGIALVLLAGLGVIYLAVQVLGAVLGGK